MKKMTYLFLLAATLGACSPKPENKIETPPKASASLFPQGEAVEGSIFNRTTYLQRRVTRKPETAGIRIRADRF